MHDGMLYDPIQGQGHDPFKVGDPAMAPQHAGAVFILPMNTARQGDPCGQVV